MTNTYEVHLGGPFDNCLKCIHLGNGCSGPRTTAMTHERYVEWTKVLKKMRNVVNQQIADETGLSKATVDDFFAGRRKDIGRVTAGMLEDYLIGGNAKWPCAMDLNKDKNIVYEDRPETLEALRVRNEQVENLRRNYEDLKKSVDHELERVREEYRDDISFYKDRIKHLEGQLQHKDEQIRRRDHQLDRKDWYIDFLIKVANKGGDLKSIDVKALDKLSGNEAE